MTEPQIWTLVGALLAFALGSLTVLARPNDRMIASLRNEMSYRFEGMEAKLDARFETLEFRVDMRLDSIDRRLEELDKEVANLATRFWGSR